MAKLLCWLWGTVLCHGATFGTAIPVRGTVSDIALDERRGILYLADFSGGRIQALRTGDLTFANSLPPLDAPASAVALSPDGRFLVAGHYLGFPNSANAGGLTIFDLDYGLRQQVSLPSPVLAVAFGSGRLALVVTANQFLLLDPETGRTQTLDAMVGCRSLPVPLATFPASITWASSGVSGDGQTIIVLARAGSAPACVAESEDPPATEPASELLLRYRVGNGQVEVLGWISTPPLAPRAVSVNADGSAFLAGWVLFDGAGNLQAQFPYALGELRMGGVAYDWARNRIYADIPAAAKEAPVLHVVDTDNLSVRERIRLPQAMAGRSVFSSDMQTLYAISDGGVLVLPVGALAEAPRVAASAEDVLFQGDSCGSGMLSQTLTVADPAGGNVDFALSVDKAEGIRITPASGTTPATVRIDVDPTVFQSAGGTTAVQLQIGSTRAVNLPAAVRLLINPRQSNSRGRLISVPGKIVDLLADAARNRVYLVRQDQNLVLVYDSTTFQQLASLRTGNTPVGLAMTLDQRYLLVGNDNSQRVSVFDLETLEPAAPILFSGVYPRTLAVSYGAIWVTGRASDAKKQGLYLVDFAGRKVSTPSLGVYCNTSLPGSCNTPVPADAVVTASPSALSILLAIPDGTVALWDGTAGRWAVSRHDFAALSGAYGALSDAQFVVDQHLLDASLYPTADLPSETEVSSGVTLAGGGALRTTAAATGGGTLERVDLANAQSYHRTPMFEAPVTAASLNTAPIGQIGQTILPFTRSLAVTADQSAALTLGMSGLTVVPLNFDAPTTFPVVSTVVNAADGGAVAPGSLISIVGTGLAPVAATAGGVPWPSSLAEVCATVNNLWLPLFRVSPTEVVAQLPYGVSGAVPLILQTPGGPSAVFLVNVGSAAPAIFHSGVSGDQMGLATVVRLRNNDLVTATNPIHPEEAISIYLTSMGATTPPVNAGYPAPFDPLAAVLPPPVVTLGSTTLAVTFAGLVPGQAGVYQINAYVPHGIADAAQAPLTILQGAASTTVLVRVVNP